MNSIERSKKDFTFLAESLLAQGISLKMVGCPVGPDATERPGDLAGCRTPLLRAARPCEVPPLFQGSHNPGRSPARHPVPMRVRARAG
jgi:hypothetical protein